MHWLLCLVIIGIGAVNAKWNTKDFMKREHSLGKPYQGMGMSVPYWDFMGSTVVTNDYIRLTTDIQSQQGSLWNSVPCNIRNWEAHIHFKTHGKSRDLFGDGFAIWYASEKMKPGPVFGYKDYFKGLAVILDTYSNHNGPHNHQHPYISAMINNGTLHYDHDRDGTHTQLDGCEAKFRNLDYDTYLSVRYEGDTLTVSTDIENKKAFKECFSVKGIQLPTQYFFGITATTGDLSDNHDILSFRLYELDTQVDPNDIHDRSSIVPSATYFDSPREHIDDPKPSAMSGLKIFFLMLVGAITVVVLVVVGIMVYQKHQENSRKRFY